MFVSCVRPSVCYVTFAAPGCVRAFVMCASSALQGGRPRRYGTKSNGQLGTGPGMVARPLGGAVRGGGSAPGLPYRRLVGALSIFHCLVRALSLFVPVHM